MKFRRGLTPLTGKLKKILYAHHESQCTGTPVSEILVKRIERATISRRKFLECAALGITSIATISALPRTAFTAGGGGISPNIIIVGAGLAGLRAAHWLYRVKGIRSTVYEGNTRAGGRCWSLRNYFDDGIVVEHGGEFINTDHNSIRNLVNNLGLNLTEVSGGSYPNLPDKYWVDGADYSYDEANQDWGLIGNRMKSALRSAPYCQTYDNHTMDGIMLDNMTVDEWLDLNVPGGLSSRFAKIMQSNVMAEYGLDPDQQSALNLIYLLGWNTQQSLDPINGADERFTVLGGNDQIVTRMIGQLPPGTVRYDKKLVAIKTNANGSVCCTFQSGLAYQDVTADRVILALPFTTLRECDLSQSGFSALKLQAINEMGLGANSKIHIQVNHRPWVLQGYGGSTYTNMTSFQTAWDATAAHPLPLGVFNFFPSGDQVISGWTGQPFGPAPSSQATAMLNQIEPIFPGMTAAYTGKAYRDAWWLNPWSKGAYTCQKPGQYTGLFGIEAKPEGNVHFAGEHTSVEYYGFLNGAIESGERAAKEVAA